MAKDRRALGIVGCVVLVLLLLGLNAGVKWSERRKEAAAASARLEAQAKAVSAEWESKRGETVAAAKKHFIEGRPIDAADMLEPYASVLVGDARALYAIAKPQSDELRAEAARKQMEAEAIAATEAVHRDQREREERKAAVRLQIDATAACTPLVERHAKHNFEWTNGWGSKFEPVAQFSGRITLAGESIKMQNGFGAWTIMSYVCEYDAASASVVRIEVKPRSE